MAALPKYTTVSDLTSLSFPDITGLFSHTTAQFQKVIHGDLPFAEFYKQTNPLGTSILTSVVLGVYTLVLAEITGNYSQVDRLWSILPTAYICHFAYWAHATGLETGRLDTIAVVAVVWSLRLTFNYWRKGGYSWGSEDYRWELVKAKIGRPAFFVLNITFISFMQNFLLLSVTFPVYMFLLMAKDFPQGNEKSKVDLIFSRSMMLAIMLEFAADQQQWNFHGAKDKYKADGKVPSGYEKSELDRGFLSSGLWAFSRHPNFAGEQLVWVLLYQWCAIATDSLYNWTGIGALSYCLLFQGSTWLTERITARKYKAYKTYQQNVNMFIPGPDTIRKGGLDWAEIKDSKAN